MFMVYRWDGECWVADTMRWTGTVEINSICLWRGILTKEVVSINQLIQIYIALLQYPYLEVLLTQAKWKWKVFRSWWIWEQAPFGRCLRSEGSPLHVVGPTTEKKRLCIVAERVNWTTNSQFATSVAAVSAVVFAVIKRILIDWVDRGQWPAQAERDRQSSRWKASQPDKHRHTKDAILYEMCCGNGSQCNTYRRGHVLGLSS